MCKLHCYSRTFNGAVFNCHDCQSLHIRFGTVQFSMSTQEFTFFCQAVCDMHDEAQKAPIVKKHTAYLSMGKKVSMVLDASQIEELRILLFKARATMSNKQTFEILVEQQKNSFYLN